ncbi:hypothetical protein HMPREF0682_2570, partial [Propionibacterium acidifaciens F0233]
MGQAAVLGVAERVHPLLLCCGHGVLPGRQEQLSRLAAGRDRWIGGRVAPPVRGGAQG